MNPKRLKGLREKVEKQGLPQAIRHVYFCGSSGCSDSPDEAKQMFKMLGKRLNELKKSGTIVRAMRVDCFCICRDGPLMVVYPEAVWYGGLTEEKMTCIIDEHLIGGKVVEDLVFTRSAFSE